jgi:hypothetical protein
MTSRHLFVACCLSFFLVCCCKLRLELRARRRRSQNSWGRCLFLACSSGAVNIVRRLSALSATCTCHFGKPMHDRVTCMRTVFHQGLAAFHSSSAVHASACAVV